MGAPDAEVVTSSSALRTILDRGRGRAALTILGPAFVASVAYVDPGNVATNFAAGSQHGYLLVWVVMMANGMAILVQYLTAKAGLLSGKSLPELCREQFPRQANLILWVQAEVVAMATDLAEFVGAALGLHLVFGVALLPAGLVTAGVAFGILALEQFGYRKFELAIIALLGLVAGGFLVDFFAVGRESATGIMAGFLPRLGGGDTLTLAVGIIGATVIPHAVYLHSALQKDRIRPADQPERRVLLRYNRWDCVTGLGLAGIVNLAMLCIAAALFHHPGLSNVGSLGSVQAHLASMAGELTALAFGIALMASGFSSSSVGTYAGQVVMTGFTGWRIPLLLRRAVTMIPSLAVLALAVNTSSALIMSQVVLSFGIPFALFPLLLVLGRRSTVGELVNLRVTNAAMWLTTIVISGLNAYLLTSTFVRA